ncbi:MAG: GNAT family N-acetyltransferase [Bacteroidetes bacterium]|nr:GNAT family N-acetyltransferase [Bacteroidota bacterium]
MLNLNFHPFPILESERLVLRKMILTDAPQLFELRSAEKTMRFIDKEKIASVHVAQTMIQNMDAQMHQNLAITWGISLPRSPYIIGTIGFWRIEAEHHRAEIGYMLHPDFWNKGYITEALHLVIDYGFSIMKLHSIEARINPQNLASRRVLEKQGFQQEGFFKENYYFNGNFLDTAVFSLLQSSRVSVKDTAMNK